MSHIAVGPKMRYNRRWYDLQWRNPTLALKLIFDKSPLLSLTSLPLRPGQARVALPRAKALYAMTGAAEGHPALWEGVFRLACTVKAHPMEEPVVSWIRDAMAHQAEDGSLPGPVADQVAVLRAAWAIYEHDAKRPLLEKLALWCGWACEHWEAVLSDAQVRVSPADLMSLLLDLYRVTGKKPLLHLCERLRAEAMDWSGALHTFSVQRPVKRIISWDELEQGMRDEESRESGFYTRQYLTCHGETLADGLRSSLMSGRFSGSGTELSAPHVGWEKISRYHGAICGGTTADETLGGASPSAAVGAASLGAWAEAFAALREQWAYDALDILFHNGLPASIGNEGIVSFQRVNGLEADCGAADCYHVGQDMDLRSLNRLCRGYAAAISSSVTPRPDGLSLNLYVPGRYAVPTAQGTLVLNVAGSDGSWAVTVHARQPIKATIRLRVPGWTDEAAVTVGGRDIGDDCVGMSITLDRTWQDGDLIAIRFARKPRVLDGYHQSACVMLGNQVMALPATPDSSWNVALCGEPVVTENGHVTVPLKRVPVWTRKDAVPVDLPVRPETDGDAFIAELNPYADTPCRIAVFTQEMQA